MAVTGAGVVGVAVGDHGAVDLSVRVYIEIARHAVEPRRANLQPLVGMVFKTAQTWCHHRSLIRRGFVSLIQSDVFRVFEQWALGIHHGPAGSVLVTGMNGEVVHLDSALVEQRRWQAHAGSVNALRVVDGQVSTGGGDGLVKVWAWPSLMPVAVYTGPKKPVTSLFFERSEVIAQTYERAAYVWSRTEFGTAPRKISKVAALAQRGASWLGWLSENRVKSRRYWCFGHV